MATLTKARIAERLYIRNPNFSQADAKNLVEDFFDLLKDEIATGEKPLKLSGFGNFTKLDKRARPGRNPKTNEPHTIEARRVCVFSAGTKLRSRCEKIDRDDS